MMDLSKWAIKPIIDPDEELEDTMNEVSGAAGLLNSIIDEIENEGLRELAREHLKKCYTSIYNGVVADQLVRMKLPPLPKGAPL
jgi:rhamnogalacturonyl hydrolase YesR